MRISNFPTLMFHYTIRTARGDNSLKHKVESKPKFLSLNPLNEQFSEKHEFVELGLIIEDRPQCTNDQKHDKQNEKYQQKESNIPLLTQIRTKVARKGSPKIWDTLRQQSDQINSIDHATIGTRTES